MRYPRWEWEKHLPVERGAERPIGPPLILAIDGSNLNRVINGSDLHALRLYPSRPYQDERPEHKKRKNTINPLFKKEKTQSNASQENWKSQPGAKALHSTSSHTHVYIILQRDKRIIAIPTKSCQSKPNPVQIHEN